MTSEEILDIFYNKIVLESQKGRIDCYFAMNIVFDVVIDNYKISECSELPYENLLIPTLKITNKPLFDSLLVEYVKKANDFYPEANFNFLNDLNALDYEKDRNIKEEYRIKYIISTLFANASFNDFANPIKFLQSRIAMFDNPIINTNEEMCLGYLNSIGAKMTFQEEISPIYSETPYRIKSYLEFSDGYKLALPEIYVGKNNEKYLLYGIQKTTKNNENDEKPYLKQIRKGLIAKLKGSPEHYFLAVMLFLSLSNKEEIEAIPFLVERWNAKRIAFYNKAKRDGLIDIDSEQEKIQYNITNIFLHYFTKISEVSNGLEFLSIPFEEDTNLRVRLNEDFNSRCSVFNELLSLVNEYNYQNLNSQSSRK